MHFFVNLSKISIKCTYLTVYLHKFDRIVIRDLAHGYLIDELVQVNVKKAYKDYDTPTSMTWQTNAVGCGFRQTNAVDCGFRQTNAVGCGFSQTHAVDCVFQTN